MSRWRHGTSCCLARALPSAVAPRDAKRALARALVERFHGAQAADAAEESFDRVHVRHEVPEHVEEVRFDATDGIVHLPALLGAGVWDLDVGGAAFARPGWRQARRRAPPAGRLDVPADCGRVGPAAWKASVCKGFDRLSWPAWQGRHRTSPSGALPFCQAVSTAMASQVGWIAPPSELWLYSSAPSAGDGLGASSGRKPLLPGGDGL